MRQYALICTTSLGVYLCMSGVKLLAVPILFFDDFETYANQSEFGTTWSAVGQPSHILDITFGHRSNQSVQLGPQTDGNGTSNRWYRSLPFPVLPSDARPVVFSFDIFLAPEGAAANWDSDWQLADVRGYRGGSFGTGSIESVIAIGVVPAGGQNLDGHDPLSFQGRVLNAVQRGATYFSLDALPTAVPRSSGWHTLAAQIGETNTTFFVDGLPAELVDQGIGAAFDSVVLGSDLASAAFWLDNIQLKQIPEPFSAALAAGLLTIVLSLGRQVVVRRGGMRGS